MEKTETKEEEYKLAPGNEPWPEMDIAHMQLGVNQIVVKTLGLKKELEMTEFGIKDIEKEIQTSIDNQAMVIKSETMKLNSMMFDRDNRLTILKNRNRIDELRSETATNERNIKAFKMQIAAGRPIRKKKEEKEKLDCEPKENGTKNNT